MRHHKSRLVTLGLVFVLLCFASSAFAVDGVIEINQAKALAGGVTPGDAAGFPVSITESGSYVLTGSLTVPDENTNGIVITGSNVSIDFNGYSILGVTVCTTIDDLGSNLSCSPSGAGVGVVVQASSVRLQNGTVSGMGGRGIGNSGHQGEIVIDNMIVSGNGQDGISFDDSPNCQVLHSTIAQNGRHGVTFSKGGRISDSVISENGANGVVSFLGGTLVIGNTIRGNGWAGIDGAFYADNVIVDNDATVAGGTQMGTNICDGNTTCP